MWRSQALLLLCLPDWSHHITLTDLKSGCLSLTGPDSVTGTVGGSLHVHCHYEKSYKSSKKYWCKGKDDNECQTIVETKGKERNGHVSIRDDDENLTMTVTMENLSEDDAGSHWCKIQTYWIFDAWSRDPAVLVKVYVFPATTPMQTTLPATTSTFPLVSTSSPVNSGQNLSISTKKMFILQLWSLLSSIHFLVLVFLKLPLFLSMLCAVFWVNRPQRAPGGR